MKTVKFTVSALAIIAASASGAFARDQIQTAGSSTVLPYATIVAEAFGENFDFPTPVVEGGDIARPEHAGACKGEHRQQHRPEPGAHPPEAPGEAHPGRQRRRTGDEIQRQQRTANRLRTQHVGDEKQEQGRRQGGGHAVGDKHREQPAE